MFIILAHFNKTVKDMISMIVISIFISSALTAKEYTSERGSGRFTQWTPADVAWSGNHGWECDDEFTVYMGVRLSFYFFYYRELRKLDDDGISENRLQSVAVQNGHDLRICLVLSVHENNTLLDDFISSVFSVKLFSYLYSRVCSLSVSPWLVELMFRLWMTFHLNPALAVK